MVSNPERRIELTKGVLASGMILIGLAAGSGTFFTLLVGASVSVGGNVLSNVVDRTLGTWLSKWLGPTGALSDHIGQGLNQAFVSAVRQLEEDWRKHPRYHYLLRANEHERARVSLEVLQELRDDAELLFQEQAELVEVLPQKYAAKPGTGQPLTEGAARTLLNEEIDKYLSIVEPLADLAKRRLPESWLLHFGEFIKSERGTPAWRACQQLWQASLNSAMEQMQHSISETQTSVLQTQQDIVRITEWLDEWGERIRTLPDTVREHTGQEALNEEVLKPHFEALQSQLIAVKADTDLILNLLKRQFTELDFNEVMLAFLQSELLADQNVNLEQAGHDTETENISLARVFVDLPASDEYRPERRDEELSNVREPSLRVRSGIDPTVQPGVIAEIVAAAEQPLDSQSVSISDSQSLGNSWPTWAERKPGHFVLIGGPGQGKTTAGQLICQLFRAAVLKNTSSDVRYGKARMALSELENVCSVEDIPFPSVPRIPFRVVLNDFAAELASEKHHEVNSLLSYISVRIRNKTERDITPGDLRRWLAEYPWVIVLDGLDEVPASSNRGQVLSAIDDFWIEVAGSNADVLVVATTRPQGYGDEFTPTIYQQKWLSPLSEVRARHYAERLVSLRYKHDHDRQRRVLDRLQSALNDDSTARLMRSPLQVTIMTALVDKIGKPPQERWTLFQRYYDVIYSREMERDIPAATILRDYRPDINAIHHRVGLLLQIESEHSGQTRARISLDRFESLVEARLDEEGHEGAELLALRKSIMDAATSRLVFLVEAEARAIGFEIRSLQEFMAAEALMQGGDALVRKRLHKIAPVINWRNVFLFSAGKCFAREDLQHLREDIRGICLDMNEHEDQRDEVAQTTLAGSQLALDLLEDGPVQRQPLYARGLARLALRLLDLPPDGYHARLASLYDSKLKNVYQEEFANRLHSTPILRLGTWSSLMHLAENQEASWATEWIDSHWPTTQEVQAEILKAASQTGRLAFMLRKMGDRILSVLPPFHLWSLAVGDPSLRDTSEIDQELPWLKALLSPIGGGRAIRISLQFADGRTMERGLAVNTIADTRATWLAAFKDISGPTSDWMPFVAGTRFAENPSKMTLAYALKQIGQHYPSITSAWAYSLLPWPLGAILNSIDGQVEFDTVVKQVEQGHFGDLSDWQAAEHRWATDGVSVDDIVYTIEDQRPFNSEIGRVGFPVLHNFEYWSPSISSDRQHHVPLLLDLFVQPKLSILRSDLAERILQSLTMSAIRRRYPPSARLADRHVGYEDEKLLKYSTFQQLLRSEPNERYVFLNTFDLVEWAGISNDEYLDFLDYVGREKLVKALLSQGMIDMAGSLSEAFISNPARVGILSLVAALVQEGVSHSIPSILLSPERYDEPKFRQAAIVVGLVASSNVEEIETLAKYVLEVSENDASIYGQIIETVDEHELTGAYFDKLLIEIYKTIPIAKWETRKQVIDSLNDSLRRRTSPIMNSWSHLGLPQHLHNLIQIQSEPV